MDQIIAELLHHAGIALSGYTAEEIENAMAYGIIWPEAKAHEQSPTTNGSDNVHQPAIHDSDQRT